jgi:cytochrome c oxidase assembly factor CtaG
VSPTDFSWEPLFLGLAAIVAAVYTYISRRQPPSHGRIVSFAAGLLLIAASLNSPLETIAAHYLLLVHLLQNALIADLAPPLVILGLTPAMRAAVTRAGGRPLDALTRPQVALPLWLLAWYGTHAAGFYDWALRSGWALNLEHAILIAAGFLFWWPLLSGRLSTPVALAYLAVAFVGSSFLGLALIFSTTPFYDYYKHTPRLWGLSPSRDQNLGGILMNAEQTLVFLTAIAYYLWRLLEEEHASGADGSRAAG